MISQKLRRSSAAAAQLKAQNKTLQVSPIRIKYFLFHSLLLHLNVTMTWRADDWNYFVN